MNSNLSMKFRRVEREMRCLGVLLLANALILGCTPADITLTPIPSASVKATIKLPEPWLKGGISLEETLLKRRSVRDYTGESLLLKEVSQLLWSAQGITGESGGRTAPSAGALYPLEVYLIAGDVEALSPGVYRYQPRRHELIKIGAEDIREELAAAALNQSCVKDGAISIVIAAVYERTTGKYGERGVRYVHMEAGHAAQNICLQATALALGTVTVGAFHDGQVRDIVGMPDNETPLYVIPVGKKRS
ncbi:MAG: SagB/ThcOx family dehydrogenase [Chloroflexota bacterium]